jgi:hypothetical protein
MIISGLGGLKLSGIIFHNFQLILNIAPIFGAVTGNPPPMIIKMGISCWNFTKIFIRSSLISSINYQEMKASPFGQHRPHTHSSNNKRHLSKFFPKAAFITNIYISGSITINILCFRNQLLLSMFLWSCQTIPSDPVWPGLSAGLLPW